MDKTKELPSELLVKILSFVPTKVAVTTRVLSKRWERLWMMVPKLESDYFRLLPYDFIEKNLLLRAPFIETLFLRFRYAPPLYEGSKLWDGITLSRRLRKLSIYYFPFDEPGMLLPSSLYTFTLLESLTLEGDIIVDVPHMVCLPSLKMLRLRLVRYLDENTLPRLLSCCPVLQDLFIGRNGGDIVYQNKGNGDDNETVINFPSLLRLTLYADGSYSSDVCVINTPSLKYFEVEDYRVNYFYLIEPMPILEEANIIVKQNFDKFLALVTSVKRLTLHTSFTMDHEAYPAGLVFKHLEHLKLRICNNYWSKLLVWIIGMSPILRALSLKIILIPPSNEYQPDSLEGRLVPSCLLESLVTFEFAGYNGRPEDRDFVTFLFKNARCLKFSRIFSFHLDIPKMIQESFSEL